jgi:molecular chaperone IbpA
MVESPKGTLKLILLNKGDSKMVNTTLTTHPFDRVKTYSIGFDRMFDTLFDESSVATTNYPPYNIVKVDDEHYAIQIAVAGFSKDDIDIESKENTLVIKTKEKKEELVDDTTYLHKGISNRAFTRSFTIADDVVVKGATYENGLLNVELERIIPEEKKPRLIKIK